MINTNRQSVLNTFSQGMQADIDPHLQPAGSYRYARNLRLLYNTDPAGAPLEGRSLSLEIMAGSQNAYCLPAGYTPIGEIDTPLGLVVFSHNGIQSEIGLVDADSESVAIQSADGYRPDGYRPVYYTLYNDQFDPNSQTLGLPDSDHFQPVTITENSLITRIYWADGTHGLRVLNVRLAWDESGLSYHHQITSGSLTRYPRHLSVHQMALLPDVAFTNLEYFGRIAGKLLSGGYQPTYRYRTKDGHASPGHRFRPGPTLSPINLFRPVPSTPTPPSGRTMPATWGLRAWPPPTG